ncbi:beta family protein [Albimonas sp. CAU 1670]|uniref:beta family protein n=1 Tax=Albimonas sp. CAU 1670 TaxID=3032599 RepID=UPI0023DCDFD0|nr:beta family protein [Albimonas sp. CAU 1670]MDF2231576.1 beta family protein [Albimonas sp. CAU 1670]
MLPYYPTLRAKPGEFTACGHTAARYRVHIKPRFVIPPATEADPEKGRPPTLDEIAHMMGERLGKNWPRHDAFLDPQFVAETLGDDGTERLFRVATAVNPLLVPVLRLPELHNPVKRRLLRPGEVRAAIYLGFEDAADPDEVLEGVRSLGLQPQECVLFVDFTETALGEDAAPSIAEIFDRLDEVGPWSKIVYQASAYPAKLPVGPNEKTLIARLEWTTFLAVLRETGIQPNRLAYGDFGADSGRMVFKTGKGGRPRPHLRYTGRTHTLVVRGSDAGKFTPTMRKVCRQIIDSEEFGGRGFSYADDRIWRNAKDLTDTCGDATGWRELNTAHHLARVIRDLGELSGISFEDDEVAEFAEQGTLL